MPENITFSHLTSYHITAAERFWGEVKSRITSDNSFEDSWKLLIPLFEEVSAKSSVQVLLWDIRKTKFIYAVDKRNVTGYDMAEYTADNGLNFSAGNIHPDYYNPGMLMNQKGVDYILGNRKVKSNKIICNMDGLYKRSNGEYFRYLQQAVCIESNNDNQPLLFLTYLQDITHLKKEKTANIVITTPFEIEIWNYDFEKKCLDLVNPLSKQEKKILACLAQSKSSKEIAAELFISPHTVDTHRRNLLERTNCINTTGLVTYAKLVGLL